MTVPGDGSSRGARRDDAEVVVVGSLNIDLAVHAARLPLAGETLIGQHSSTDEGGKGANQAVAAARMGARVAMIGCVGRDAQGERLLDALRREGIATGAVGVDPSLPTGVAAIVVAADGQNAIVVVPGANLALDPIHVEARRSLLESARIVVVQLEVSWAAAAAALALAHRAGATTVLNAAPAARLCAEQLADVEWLVVNESEAALMTGLAVGDVDSASDAARALASLGPTHVVVTLGSAGLVHASPEGLVHIQGFQVVAVDSTGAGDMFVGTLAASLAHGLPPSAALRWGQAAAALAVTRRGSQSAMPTRADVVARWGDPALARPPSTSRP